MIGMLEIMKGMLQNLLITKSTSWVDSITTKSQKGQISLHLDFKMG
jgi:hypothetical protein